MLTRLHILSRFLSNRILLTSGLVIYNQNQPFDSLSQNPQCFPVSLPVHGRWQSHRKITWLFQCSLTCGKFYFCSVVWYHPHVLPISHTIELLHSLSKTLSKESILRAMTPNTLPVFNQLLHRNVISKAKTSEVELWFACVSYNNWHSVKLAILEVRPDSCLHYGTDLRFSE